MTVSDIAPVRQRDELRSHEDRLKMARAILPLLTAEADDGEKLTHLTDVAVDAMKDAGFLHLLLPRELGGEQAMFLDAMEIIEMLAWADGSAGWYAMVANAAAASLGGFLPDKGAEIIYGANPRTMAAGQGVPRGTAKRVEGGYLVTGPWSYGSTIFHAQYYHCGCTVFGDDGKPVLEADGSPKGILVHFPKDQGVLQGNWDTLGLRGTGSYDYNVAKTDLFVPEYMTYAFTGEPPRRGGSQYSIGIVGFTAWCHASWAIGVTRRALDEVRKLAPQKAGPFGPLGNSATFRQDYAAGEAKYRAARAFLRDVWHDIDVTLQGESPASIEQIALAKMAMRHMHDVGSEVTTFAYRAGGGVALRPSLLQRAFRDMHAATQHLLLSDQIYQECGRVMLGMAGKGGRWTTMKLIEE